MLHELDELLKHGPTPSFDAQLEELNARIDAVQPPSRAAAATVTGSAEVPPVRPPPPRRIVPRPIARATWKCTTFDGECEPVDAEQLDIKESWSASFRAHQSRQHGVAAVPFPAVTSEPAPHTELSSDRLEDLLELAAFANVTWPPGLDARIARQILEGRVARGRT